MNAFSVSAIVLLVASVHVSLADSSLPDERLTKDWCSKFPDEEAKAECAHTVGSFWMYSPTCCNVKWECVNGEYNQGLRCKESGFVPDRELMKCTEEASCIDTTSTEAPTTTTTVRVTTTTLSTSTLSTTSVSGSPQSSFCDSFPADEPPVYCGGTTGSFWMSSPSCCNVKFECLDGAYNQGFRCSSPGYVPDVSRLKCQEDNYCVREEESPSEDAAKPEIVCWNSSTQFLPHPSDCSKYFQCANGVVLHLECLIGSIFSYQFQRCLPGDNKTCELLGV